MYISSMCVLVRFSSGGRRACCSRAHGKDHLDAAVGVCLVECQGATLNPRLVIIVLLLAKGITSHRPLGSHLTTWGWARSFLAWNVTVEEREEGGCMRVHACVHLRVVTS